MASLFNIFDSVSGTDFIGIDTLTEEKFAKRHPLHGRVTKTITGANVMVFGNAAYEGIVKRRLEKEGKNPEDFTVSPRRWGTRVENSPFIEHKGSMYLEVIFLSAGTVELMLDGNVISRKDLAALVVDGCDETGLKVPAKWQAGEETEAEQGGLEDKVIYRDYKFESITGVRINKETYLNPTA